jgi:hypothetical protein
VNGCSILFFASRSAVSFPAVSSWPGTHINELCYVWPVVWGIGGNPRPVLRYLVLAKCFNCSLTVHVSILIVPI